MEVKLNWKNALKTGLSFVIVVLATYGMLVMACAL